jgi:hypothetical protein
VEGWRVECRGIPLKPKYGLNGAPSWICWSKFKNLGGLRPDFLWGLVALANLMRLSLLKAAHVAVGECPVAGNRGRPSFSAQVRSHGTPGQVGERGAPVLFLIRSFY